MLARSSSLRFLVNGWDGTPSDKDNDDSDDDYSITSVSSVPDSESDLEDFLPEEAMQCDYTADEDEVRRYTMRKRTL